MCGRFALTVDAEQLRQTFPWLNIPEATQAALQPRYNIAPSQPVAVIPNDGRNQLDFFLWGLIPSWAKDPGIGNRMINARAETLTEKPSFRTAFRRRRCLIPVSGFYEWKPLPGSKSKIPMYICRQSKKPFVFAGLWDSWNSPDGSQILSCTIITTQANELMKSIHHRMPLILPESAYALWLTSGDCDPNQLRDLLQPFPDKDLTAYPVSTLVNNPDNDLPACISPST